MPSLMMLLLLLWSQQLSTVSGETQSNERFFVVWNIPIESCIDKFSVKFNFEQYGIRANNDNRFYGEHIVTLYAHKIGKFPYYDAKNATMINDAIPQKGNLVAHLEKTRDDIIQAIPDRESNTLAVIDFEEWRPTFATNWGIKAIYRNLSIAYGRDRYPLASGDKIRDLAVYEFDRAARRYFVETIRLGIKLRPSARWGYYGFPMCNYDSGADGENSCSEGFTKHNKNLRYIRDASTALYPSIYLNNHTRDESNNLRYIQSIMKETNRWIGKRRLPFYVFIRYLHNPYDEPASFVYYRKADLCASIKTVADMGASGIIIWGPSVGTNTKEKCESLSTHLDTTVGPFIREVKTFFDNCSRIRCSNRGRCVRTMAAGNDQQCEFNDVQRYVDYNCRCDTGYRGYECELQRRRGWT